MSGRSGLKGRLSWLPAQIPVFDGRMTRSSLITEVGTEQTRTITLTGMIPFMTAWAIPAETIRRSLAMITSTAAIPPAPRLVMTAALIRSGWRPAQNGSVVVIWTRALAHRQGTSSAWNFSSRRTHSTAHPTKATRRKRPILQPTPGVARFRKVALPATSCEPPLKLRKLLVSKW